jgi:hypothetical protein
MGVMKIHTLHIAILGLTIIGVTALITNHDGPIIDSVIGAILMIAGYAISKRKNGDSN